MPNLSRQISRYIEIAIMQVLLSMTRNEYKWFAKYKLQMDCIPIICFQIDPSFRHRIIRLRRKVNHMFSHKVHTMQSKMHFYNTGFDMVTCGFEDEENVQEHNDQCCKQRERMLRDSLMDLLVFYDLNLIKFDKDFEKVSKEVYQLKMKLDEDAQY